MPIFKKLAGEPLPLTMAGVRAGERLLQLGIDSAKLIAMLAAKVGMNGTAAHVVTNESDAARVRDAAAQEGVLIDVKMTGTLRSIPFEDESFDLVVIHSMSGLVAGMAPYTRVRCLEEVHRVLRPGGRVLVIEPEPRGGLAGIFRSHAVDGHYLASGETAGSLKAEDFKAARVLADREGYRFVEGLKG
jgi:ubiquinone/menaquinone biosynthesis C-methylase UbiE